MDAAKIQLSPEEMALVLRPDWILTKNGILKKVWQLLETLQTRQEQYLDVLPTEIKTTNGKISKGENYKGLPYLILDQPRYFDKDHIFAIRTMFWWGHFFSSTFQLAGRYKLMYEKAIVAIYPLLKEKEFYVCVNDDPWQHHFEENNFTTIAKLSRSAFEYIIYDKPFIKLARKLTLEDWDNAGVKLEEIFLEYIKIAN